MKEKAVIFFIIIITLLATVVFLPRQALLQQPYRLCLRKEGRTMSSGSMANRHDPTSSLYPSHV
jgi:hypothetical protein